MCPSLKSRRNCRAVKATVMSSGELVEAPVLPTLVQLLQCSTAALDVQLRGFRRKFLPVLAGGALVAELLSHSVHSSVLRVNDHDRSTMNLKFP